MNIKTSIAGGISVDQEKLTEKNLEYIFWNAFVIKSFRCSGRTDETGNLKRDSRQHTKANVVWLSLHNESSICILVLPHFSIPTHVGPLSYDIIRWHFLCFLYWNASLHALYASVRLQSVDKRCLVVQGNHSLLIYVLAHWWSVGSVTQLR